MRRLLKWLAWILGGLLTLLTVLIAVLIIGGDTGPGHAMLDRLIAKSTGGTVTATGGPVWWPGHLHFSNLELRDKAGAYLRLHNVTIRWSILQLIHRKADIDTLTVGSAILERLPQSSTNSTSSSGLPVTVDLHKLAVDRLELAPAIAGKPFALKLVGSGTLLSYSSGSGQLTVSQIGGPALYKLTANVNAKKFNMDVSAHEPAHGLISSLAHLPQLGAITIDGKMAGPRDAIATQLAVTAGKLSASARGTVNLTNEAAELTLAAHAPAMRPKSGLSWQSVALQAHLQGKFAKPTVSGHVAIDQVAAYGSAARRIDANVSGNEGLVHVAALAYGLQIPGSQPNLLAGAPLKVDATVHLAEPHRPIDFAVRNPLIMAQGSAQTKGVLQARVHLVIPQLQPFAAVAGAKLQGHTDLMLRGFEKAGTTQLAVSGTIGVNSGPKPAPALVGNNAHIDTVVDLQGHNLTITRFALTGRDASAAVHGSVANGTVNLDWTMALSRLAAIDPSLRGQLRGTGHVGGTTQNVSLVADLNGDVTAKGMNSGPFSAHLEAQGLPHTPKGKLTAYGSLLGAPVELAVAAQRLSNGAYHVAIDQAAWKSTHAQGQLTVSPPALVPKGQLTLTIARLSDLDPLLHKRLTGSISAKLDSTATAAHLTAAVEHAAVPGTASIARADLRLAIANPTTHPMVDGELAVNNFSSGKIGGSATLHARGPEDALALRLAADLPRVYGAAARLGAAAVVNVPQRAVRLDTLRAAWKKVTLRLLHPARVAQIAGGVRLEHVRLAVNRGTLDVNGDAGKTLNLSVDLRNLPASIATVVAPSMSAGGTISAGAHLTGTASNPDGMVRVEAHRIQLRSGPGRAMPPADLTADATLRGGQARINAKLDVGRSHLQLSGLAPITGKGNLDLRTTGAVDLVMLDPLLAAEGRRVTGRLAMNARIAGSVQQPLVVGTATLSNGNVQDYTYGVHLRDVTGAIQADGKNLRLTRFIAHAGPGTISGTGTVSLAAPMPVNLAFTAHDAAPISNEIVTERLDSNLRIVGDVEGKLAVQGAVQVPRANIQIPDKLPQQVATIPVRNPNAPPKPPKKSKPATNLALNLTINAGDIFVRGHGLYAVLGGTIHVRGTSANPLPSGGLTLRQGTFSLAGTSLHFTEGTVDFIGAGISDPALHFVATTFANNITATLTVGGTARDPKITLSSVPQLPQDEILAQILFHRSISSLSPFEVAQVAAAVASFSGVTSGIDPLADLRQTLGLDRLSVGTNPKGNPELQAGRYLAPGVYLGAKQSATGSGTQAQVQINLTKRLKLDTTAGSSSMSATGADSSGQEASVGLTYQFQY